MIIGHRNYRSYDEVMIKLQYDEFVRIYDHHNIFSKIWSFRFFICLFKCSIFNIFVYGSLICIYLMNILVNWLMNIHASTSNQRLRLKESKLESSNTSSFTNKRKKLKCSILITPAVRHGSTLCWCISVLISTFTIHQFVAILMYRGTSILRFH